MLVMDDLSDSEMYIKVTGWQWKWEYEYLDNGVHFFSSLDEASNRARQKNSGIDPRSVPNYLLEVDHPLVIPINTKVRFLFTAADVIHSWWVPDFGWKKDANPGFINEGWTNVTKPGTYRGQCTELCGKDHGYMPIVVIAMEKEDYAVWVEEQKAIAIAEENAADRDWAVDELMAEGASVYTNNCASCHMADGAGMPGTFPAITDSSLVIGDMAGQVDLMLKGKEMMPAFGQMLSAVDFAAVSTYIRNDLGNSVGDSIQPSEIQALQSALAEQEDEGEDE
jgi:cytochrome c oxidase subunit 2